MDDLRQNREARGSKREKQTMAWLRRIVAAAGKAEGLAGKGRGGEGRKGRGLASSSTEILS